jgi:DNA-binding beta-propeller fold protein YncE
MSDTANYFAKPQSIAIFNDVLYVTDGGISGDGKTQHCVWKIILASDRNSIKSISLLAGGSAPSYLDGKGSLARFNSPTAIDIDNDGTIYIADTNNHCIRSITLDGTVATIAGRGMLPGYKDNVNAYEALFNEPYGLALDPQGRFIYIADSGNSCIRSIDRTTWRIKTISGVPNQEGDVDGPGETAKFNVPKGMAVDADGNIYVADFFNNKIRKLKLLGDNQWTVETYAGSGADGFFDGALLESQFSNPVDITIKQHISDLYVTEQGLSNRVRYVTSEYVGTLAGGGTTMPSSMEIGASLASFNSLGGLVFDSLNNIYAIERNSKGIIKFNRSILNKDSVIEVVAVNGFKGYRDGKHNIAQFNLPGSLCIDKATDCIYIADTYNHRIRRITKNGEVTTFAGSGKKVSVDGKSIEAGFDTPQKIAIDSQQTVYVLEDHSTKLRAIDRYGNVDSMLFGATYIVDIAVDNEDNLLISGKFGDSKIGIKVFDKNSKFLHFYKTTLPERFTIDENNNIYISVLVNRNTSSAIKRVPKGGKTFQEIIRLDKGKHILEMIAYKGFIYYTNEYGIFRIDLNTNEIKSVAECVKWSYYDGPTSIAKFDVELFLVIDDNDNIYISDRYNNCIRKIDNSNIVSTFAGGCERWSSATYTERKLMFMRSYLDKSDNIYLFNSFLRNYPDNTPIPIYSLFKLSKGMIDELYTVDKYIQPICIDSISNVLICNQYSQLIKFDQTMQVQSTLFIAPGWIRAISFDKDNRIYLSVDVTTMSGQRPYKTKLIRLSPNGIIEESIDIDGSYWALAIDLYGNIYLGDYESYSVIKITKEREIIKYGNGTMGFKDGLASEAQFGSIYSICIDPIQNNIYVVESTSTSIYDRTKSGIGKIRLINADGHISTLELPSFRDSENNCMSFSDITVNALGDILLYDKNYERLIKILSYSVKKMDVKVF